LDCHLEKLGKIVDILHSVHPRLAEWTKICFPITLIALAGWPRNTSTHITKQKFNFPIVRASNLGHAKKRHASQLSGIRCLYAHSSLSLAVSSQSVHTTTPSPKPHLTTTKTSQSISPPAHCLSSSSPAPWPRC